MHIFITARFITRGSNTIYIYDITIMTYHTAKHGGGGGHTVVVSRGPLCTGWRGGYVSITLASVMRRNISSRRWQNRRVGERETRVSAELYFIHGVHRFKTILYNIIVSKSLPTYNTQQYRIIYNMVYNIVLYILCMLV